MTRFLVVLGQAHRTMHVDVIGKIRRRFTHDSGWKTVLASASCHVAHFHSATDPSFQLPDGRGAILGPIFCRRTSIRQDWEAEPTCPLRSLPESACRRAIDSAGESLGQDYWGHYIAVLLDKERQQWVVLRSPVSSVPCLHVQVESLHIFFSDVGDFLPLKLSPLTINWDSITAQIMHTDYLNGETGLREITALDCGEAVICAPLSRRSVRYWNPKTALAEPKSEDFASVVRGTREKVMESAAALSSLHSHLLVSLSGGLDSSIVLSALRHVAPHLKLTAVNSYSVGTGDERAYARRMAEAANCRMIELPRDDHLDFRIFEDVNLTVQPVLNFSAPDSERRISALARDIGATAIVDGEFGDNVFGSNITTGSLIECFRLHRFGPTFLRASIDFAFHTRQSLWRVWQLAWAENSDLAVHKNFSAVRELQRRYTIDGFGSMILASHEAAVRHMAFRERFLHPWLKGSRCMAPSAQSLLFGLIVVTSSAYASPFTRSADPQRLSPLINQPLVDLMLRVPAYLHFLRGQNRAVARTAFADLLPVEILERGVGKGGPVLWAKAVIESNASFLRTYLLDGILVNQGLLDRGKVQDVLSPKIEKSSAMVSDVFSKIYIEAWLRKWRTVTSDTVVSNSG